MPTTEHDPSQGTRPPIRALPEDYDQDVDRLTSKYRLPDDLEPEMRAIEREMSDLMGGGITVCDVLRTAIRAVLDERDTALVERAERLRRALIDEGFKPTLDEGDGDAYPFNPGDLVDDLRPRGEDVLES